MSMGRHDGQQGWKWAQVSEVALDIQSGFAFRKRNLGPGDVLHLRPYNINENGELNLEQKFFVPRSALPRNWSALEPGDVLFNNTNSVELVGKTALVRERMDAAFSNHITRIRVRPDMCEGAWLALVLNALRRQGFFAAQCKKWIGQAGFNTTSLRATLIPLPPLVEQRRIVTQLESVYERIRALKVAQADMCARLRLLEDSVIMHAYRGEL